MADQAPTPPTFLDDLDRYDPDFANLFRRGRDAAFTESALPTKTKWLLMLALDMAFLSPVGTKVMADRARAAGATEAEIADVLKQAFVNAGAQRMATYTTGHRTEAPDPSAPPRNSGNWHQPFEAAAPEFAKLMLQMRDQLWAPSALDTKTKYFISMVLDMRLGLANGARAMAAEARKAGATEAELVDVIKVAWVQGGAARANIGVQALVPILTKA